MSDPQFPGRLSGRTAIVTGAASGFGAATARRFHAEGAKVVLADLDEAGAAAIASELGGDALAVRVDVTRSDDVAALMTTAVSAFGGLDIMVNNAGIIHAKGPIEEIDLETFDRIMAVNLRGVFLGIKHSVPHLRRSEHGVILNTASVGALRPRRQTSVYSASKLAVISLTQSAALELAPRIRVNAVCPVAADTPFLAGSAGGSGDILDRYRAQMAADAVNSVPMGRLATPEDVAAVYTFLASDDAAFLTGLAIPVDGGRSAGDATGAVGIRNTASTTP